MTPHDTWRVPMRAALLEARKALATHDVPIGAVVLDPAGHIIARGHNVRERDGDPTGHAEVQALRAAAAIRGEWRLTGCTVVSTLEPCTMCAGAAVQSRVSRIVFGAHDDKYGAVGSLWDVVRDRRLNHRPEVVSGVLAAECSALLDTFFAAHRGTAAVAVATPTSPPEPVHRPRRDESGRWRESVRHMDTLDFGPTATTLAALATATTDDQLGGATPCPAYTVGDLVDHIVGLTFAFTQGALRIPLPEDQAAPEPDAAHLAPDWRDTLPGQMDALAAAWADPAAYEGEAQAGPMTVPAPVAALVALNEITVHAWDLASATGQTYDADPAAVAACTEFVTGFEPPEGGATDDGGLFGPRVVVGDDATPLDRLLGLAGRDPAWTSN